MIFYLKSSAGPVVVGVILSGFLTVTVGVACSGSGGGEGGLGLLSNYVSQSTNKYTPHLCITAQINIPTIKQKIFSACFIFNLFLCESQIILNFPPSPAPWCSLLVRPGFPNVKIAPVSQAQAVLTALTASFTWGNPVPTKQHEQRIPKI